MRDQDCWEGSCVMKQIPMVLTLSVFFLLFSAAIAVNFSGAMPEMRGAWVAQALR